MSARKAITAAMIILFVVAIMIELLTYGLKLRNELEYVPEVKTVTITGVGDCTFGTDVNMMGEGSFDSYAKKQNGDYSYFLKNFAPIFAEDNLTIVNFEGTLSTGGYREDKEYAFRGKPEYVQILTSSSVEAANLANNHSADYGEQSLADTIKNLNEAGITNFIGTNTAIVDVDGIKVGLVGINALNESEASKLEKAIGSVKKKGVNLVILCIHWGVEKDFEPNEEQKEIAHKAVDLGADLVLGSHPHVLQGIERYNGKYIIYSLGNFCFGGNDNPGDIDTMVFRQVFTFVDGTLQLDDNYTIIPATISGSSEQNDYQPQVAEGEKKTEIQTRLLQYSKDLGLDELNFR